MSVNSSFLCFCIVFLVIVGCGAYLVNHSGEVVEANIDVTTLHAELVEANSSPNVLDLTTAETIIKPYNILDTKPRPKCPEGFVLANKRCHKRVKWGL